MAQNVQPKSDKVFTHHAQVARPELGGGGTREPKIKALKPPWCSYIGVGDLFRIFWRVLSADNKRFLMIAGLPTSLSHQVQCMDAKYVPCNQRAQPMKTIKYVVHSCGQAFTSPSRNSHFVCVLPYSGPINCCIELKWNPETVGIVKTFSERSDSICILGRIVMWLHSETNLARGELQTVLHWSHQPSAETPRFGSRVLEGSRWKKWLYMRRRGAQEHGEQHMGNQHACTPQAIGALSMPRPQA